MFGRDRSQVKQVESEPDEVNASSEGDSNVSDVSPDDESNPSSTSESSHRRAVKKMSAPDSGLRGWKLWMRRIWGSDIAEKLATGSTILWILIAIPVWFGTYLVSSFNLVGIFLILTLIVILLDWGEIKFMETIGNTSDLFDRFIAIFGITTASLIDRIVPGRQEDMVEKVKELGGDPLDKFTDYLFIGATYKFFATFFSGVRTIFVVALLICCAVGYFSGTNVR